MITEKEIIICKELIDAVDDILWEKLCGPNKDKKVDIKSKKCYN